MSTLPRLVVHDVAQHGVAGYARDLASAIAAAGGADLSVRRKDVGDLPPGTALHLQFTDRLWAESPEAAAESVRVLAEKHPLSVTFHDVPQASDGPRNLPRRLDCYRAVINFATGVVVNSAHEAALLREYGVSGSDAAPAAGSGPQSTPGVEVIPLPVDVEPRFAGDARAPDGSVGVLGFFYPGKGHDEALRAAVDASVPALTVLGRASDGHAGDLEAFVREAAALGVRVEVTGYLDDAELRRRCRGVAVPVVAHRHVSASGSLGSWIAAGRRPVAVANRYIDEMAALRPGTLTMTRPDDLATAVAAAVRDPASTWLSTTAVPHGRRDVAATYLAWWRRLPW